jgi:hypothetical protein
MATLDIQALTEIKITEFWGVYIKRLQDFIADVSPDKEARIHAKPQSDVKEKIEPLNMSISEVTEEVLEEISKDYEMEDWEGNIKTFAGLYEVGSFTIQLEGQYDPIFKLTLWPGYAAKENRPFFKIEEMHYSGFTDKVEAVMDKVVNHLFVPASPKEVPETQGYYG